MDDCTIPLKRCTKCGEEKPATPEYFSKDQSKSCGLRPSCKLCDRQRRADTDTEERRRKARARAKQWVKDNPERAAASHRARYESNREQKRQYDVEYKIKNADKIRARRAANRESARAYNHHYYFKHHSRERERNRQYMMANLDRIRQRNQGRAALKRTLEVGFTEALWRMCLDYWHNTCAYCGQQRDFWHNLEQEHFIPMTSGGGYTTGNIVPSCKSCNSSKGNKSAHDWLTSKFGARKAKQILARIEAYFESIRGLT